MARIEELRITPELGGKHSLPYAGYTTDPPVEFDAGTCHVGLLRPVHGYRLDAGRSARVWAVYHALRPGVMRMRGITVYYTQGGRVVRQFVPAAYTERVRRTNTVRLRPSRYERPCLSHTTPLAQG